MIFQTQMSKVVRTADERDYRHCLLHPKIHSLAVRSADVCNNLTKNWWNTHRLLHKSLCGTLIKDWSDISWLQSSHTHTHCLSVFLSLYGRHGLFLLSLGVSTTERHLSWNWWKAIHYSAVSHRTQLAEIRLILAGLSQSLSLVGNLTCATCAR